MRHGIITDSNDGLAKPPLGMFEEYYVTDKMNIKV